MARSVAEGRRSRVLLVVLALEAAALMMLVVGDGTPAETDRALVAALGLTDLALWSEASYCRHPSQADLFAPHAAHPGALEHYPAGSIVPPRPAFGASGAGGWGGP